MATGKRQLDLELSIADRALESFKRGEALSEEEAVALTRCRVANPKGDIYFGGVSMTDPSFGKDCDINNIMAQYIQTGDIRGMRQELGISGDFSEVGDYASAMEVVQTADALFMELPAAVRSEFGHDPQRMYDFVQDPKNRDRAIALGMIDPPAPEVAPVRVEVVTKEPPK